MGYTEKLTKIQNTKSELKDNINDLGGNITTSTTFREYSDKLENIYNNLPKIADTNSDITLANTNKGKMVIESRGNTSQNTIAGNQMVDCTNIDSFTNYGLTATVQSDGSILLNASEGVTHYIDIYVASANVNTDVLEKMNTNLGSYSFSNNLGLTSYFRWRDVGASSASYTASTITLTEGQTVTGLFVRISEGAVFNNDVLKVMVNTGSTALDWEQYVGNAPSPNPSYPQDIKVVKGNNTITVTKNNTSIATKQLNLGNIELAMIPSHNLVDENNLTSRSNIAQIKNKIITSTVLNTSASSTAIGAVLNIPTFKPEAGTYYVSADVRLVSGSVRNNEITAVQMWAHDAWTASSSWATTAPALSNEFQRYTRKYTINSIGTDANYVYAFYVQVYGATDAVLEVRNLQVSKENSDYIARDAYSDVIFKNEPNNPNYDNTLVENGWYKKSYIKTKTYNQNDEFQLGGASNDNYYIFQTYMGSNLIGKNLNENELICDKFVCVGTENASINANKEQLASNLNALTCGRFTIAANRLTEKSISAFQTWLNTNNVTVKYIATTPEYTQITDTTLLEQLEALNRTIIPGETITVSTESDSNNARLIVNTSALDS